MRRKLWWGALLLFLLHQWAQKIRGWPGGIADHYLDPLLCMPLLLGLLEWEWHRRLGKPAPGPWEIAALTALFALLFEWGFPAWHPGFTSDPWDVAAYIAGSVIYWYLLKKDSASHSEPDSRR